VKRLRTVLAANSNFIPCRNKVFFFSASFTMALGFTKPYSEQILKE
jgi:hypothetical protein